VIFGRLGFEESQAAAGRLVAKMKGSVVETGDVAIFVSLSVVTGKVRQRVRALAVCSTVAHSKE
jgi:hypothetical protein